MLLLTPENREIREFRAGQHNNFTQLTMPYLAGFVPASYQIRLVDEYSEPVPYRYFDLVAITVNTPNAPHVYEMAGKFRRLGSWVVLGGPHVTLNPDEAAGYADTIVAGEAEDTWPEFLNDFLKGKPKRKYECTSPPSLQGLPIPRRDLIVGHLFTSGAVFSSRGCPYHCSYCCLKSIYCSQFRTRPVAEVTADIAAIAQRHFVFWDDNFFADKGYVRELLQALIPLGKKWAAQVTAHDCLDDELLGLAKRAGCIYLFIGLESFTPQGLADADKSINRVGEYGKIVERLHRHGISVQAGVVFGFDSDGPQVFALAAEQCARIGIDGVTVSLLTPFPGTPLYEKYRAEKRLLPVDWSYYNGKTKVAYRPKRMSGEELLAGYQWFRKKFYSWAGIIRRLLKIRVNAGYNLAMNLGYKRAIRKNGGIG